MYALAFHELRGDACNGRAAAVPASLEANMIYLPRSLA